MVLCCVSGTCSSRPACMRCSSATRRIRPELCSRAGLHAATPAGQQQRAADVRTMQAAGTQQARKDIAWNMPTLPWQGLGLGLKASLVPTGQSMTPLVSVAGPPLRRGLTYLWWRRQIGNGRRWRNKSWRQLCQTCQAAAAPKKREGAGWRLYAPT